VILAENHVLWKAIAVFDYIHDCKMAELIGESFYEKYKRLK